jgi:hypothetical protein
VLCVILVLSVYTGFVGLVSDLFGHDFIETLSLSSRGGSDGGNRFFMGDTLTVSARVKQGNVYSLSVYDNSDRPVFEEEGAVNDGGVTVDVPLYPPAFNTSRVYTLSLQVGVSSYPLPGVSAYDFSPAESFTVVRSMTRLNLTSSYDETTHELQQVAFLTTSQGLPVENRTVNFYLQPNMDFAKPDRGWTLLDSAQTDANGSASCQMVLSMMGGLHGLEARFVGDESFGSSCADNQFSVGFRPTLLRVVEASKTTSTTSVVLQLTEPSGLPLGGKMLSFEAMSPMAGPVYAVTDDRGYAVMNFTGPVQAYVDSKITVLGDDYVSRYQACVRLVQNGSDLSVASSWGESGLGSLAIGAESRSSACTAALSAVQGRALEESLSEIDMMVYPNASACADLPEVIYSCLVLDHSAGALTFSFYLNETYQGSQSAKQDRCYDGQWWYVYYASFLWYPDVSGSYTVGVLANKTSNNSPVGEGSVDITVGRAYCNMVVYYPGAFVGDDLTLTVAFSKARTQNQTDGSGYFQTVNFAPVVSWNNSAYSLDQATGAPIIHLYLNDQPTELNDTGGTGLCFFTLNSSGLPSINVTAIVEENDRFQGITISQGFNLTSVTITDNPTVAANPQNFSMSYTMSVLTGADTTYVNSGNIVETQVTMLNNSAYNVAAHFTAARLGTRIATNSSCCVAIPAGCNYTLLRVANACDNSSNVQNPWTDLDHSGRVDMKDIGILGKALDTCIGDARYDWISDVNADGKVDTTDDNIVHDDYGGQEGQVNYLPNGTYSPDFDYRGVSVDSDAGPIFLDSRGFAFVPSNATWLALSCKADVEFFNSTFQDATVTDNGGRAHVTWNPSLEGAYPAEVCVTEVGLTSPLNLTVAAQDTPSETEMNASLLVASYYYVLKRPVDVSVSWDSQQQNATLTACADAYVDSCHPDHTFDTDYLWVGCNDIYEGFIRFDLSSIPANISVVSARLNVYEYFHVGTADYEVHRVTGTWEEQSLTYNNRPQHESIASCVLYNVPSQTGMWLSFDVTSDVRCWSNDSNSNCGLVLIGNPSSSSYIALYSKDDSHSKPPQLEISLLNGSQDVVVSAYDEALQCPAEVGVDLYVNGAWNATQSTNQSGLWDVGALWPSTGGLWNLTASSSATQECAAGTSSTTIYLGLPTTLTPIGGNVTDASTGTVVSNFTLFSSSIFPIAGGNVSFCVNATLSNGTVYSQAGSGVTMSNGTVRFTWTASNVSTFLVHAAFAGDQCHAPCDGYSLVTVNTLPLSVQFSISPSDPTPNTTVTLNATIISPMIGSRFTDHNVTVKFCAFASNGTPYTVGTANSTGGQALLNLTYPNDGKAHAFNATILCCTDGYKTVSNVISSPVQLSVGHPATLVSAPILNFTSTSRELEYYFENPNHGMMFLGNRTIEVKINDTSYTCTTEEGNGVAALTRDFPAVNNSATTYIITAAFNGDNPLSATANSTAADGTSYTACTTAQYNINATTLGYKPSSNTITLTVDPHSTLATTLTKTPEQMQQEAQDKNVLNIWPEFSWWFPWFKIVAEVNVPFDTGVTTFRFELIPIAFQQVGYVKSGADALVNALVEIVGTVGADVLTGYFISYFITPRIAASVACSSIVNVAWVVLIYAAVQIGVVLALNLVLGKMGLAIGIVSFFIAAVVSAFSAGLGVISDWVQAIGRGASGQIESVWHSWWGRGLNFVNIVEVFAFFFVDVCLGAFLAVLL